MKNYLLITLLIAFIISCSSKDTSENIPQTGLEEFPSWVIDPQIEGGIAASECIPYSGNISIDKAQITAQARSTLAKQIEVRVTALDKTYIDRTDAAGKTIIGSSFSSVSKQFANQNLIGTRLEKLSRINISEQQNICGMLILDPEKSETVFQQIIEGSQRDISAQDEDILYQEFKAHRAQEDLDRLLEQQ